MAGHPKLLSLASCQQDVVRVMLWCVPRSSSTAFLKCMTFVPHSQVWCEPYLMGYHYSKYGKYRENVLKFLRENWAANDIDQTVAEISGGYLAKDKTNAWFKEQLEDSPPNTKVIFGKDMSRGIDGHYEDLPQGFRHTFLIRHPYKVFDSWKRMINRGIKEESKKLKLTDQPEHHLPKGYHFKELFDLYLYVKENIEPNPIIIDTDDLLANPGRVLEAYCHAVGIPYSDDLLQWKPGSECMNDVWMSAKEEIFMVNLGTGDIHKKTFASTRFNKPTKMPNRSELSDDILFCSDRCIEYYNELYANRLKI